MSQQAPEIIAETRRRTGLSDDQPAMKTRIIDTIDFRTLSRANELGDDPIRRDDTMQRLTSIRQRNDA